MKTIRCWNDLRDYGIVLLTGEACGLSYRLLCDVTAKGKRTLEKALSIQQLGLAENWNHGSDDDEHVGSIMLPPDALSFHRGLSRCWKAAVPRFWLTKSSGVVGIEPDDSPDRVEAFKRFHADDLSRRFRYAGTAGDRNRHVMSGRVY